MQHALLRTLRPRAFRLLRLQLLHPLLQAIDAILTIRRLARQHLALPLLHHLLALLDLLLLLLLRTLLNLLLRLLRTLLDLLTSRQPLAHGRRWAWTRGGGDMWRRPRCHGRSLRRCRRPVEFRPRRRHVRGRARRRSEMWGRARRR
ncbi:hypothetical protein [Bradyrhizobium hipponense]|uniref:hypothetical protein n=1 Tax=Bradyrhizobium hipponense TaxID=2605638 RepID=UPI001F258163|nr:hypothetical protein [Bradyrhizobium hipponense]